MIGGTPALLDGDLPTGLNKKFMATSLFIISWQKFGDMPALLGGDTPTLLINHQCGTPIYCEFFQMATRPTI